MINKIIKKSLIILPDKIFLKILFRYHLGYRLNLKNPKTFNEKIQWLKLYDRNPKYTQMVDKYEVRKYISEKIGEEYLITLLGVWDKFEDIDFNKLPNQFVLKCTHDSGSVYICRSKMEFDKETTRKKISAALKINYYYSSRERPYKDVRPRIVAEKYLGDNIVDYKFNCFNGIPDSVMVCIGRSTGNVKFYFFDLEWNLLRINATGAEAPKDFTLPKPERYEDMINIAKILSKGHRYLRVDLYSVNNQIYFGELTFYPLSGFDVAYLPETDLYLGKKLNLKKG